MIDADNGDDAILLAREHRPELALLDIPHGRVEWLPDVAADLREHLQIPFTFCPRLPTRTERKVRLLGASWPTSSNRWTSIRIVTAPLIAHWPICMRVGRAPPQADFRTSAADRRSVSLQLVLVAVGAFR